MVVEHIVIAVLPLANCSLMYLTAIECHLFSYWDCSFVVEYDVHDVQLWMYVWMMAYEDEIGMYNVHSSDDDVDDDRVYVVENDIEMKLTDDQAMVVDTVLWTVVDLRLNDVKVMVVNVLIPNKSVILLMLFVEVNDYVEIFQLLHMDSIVVVVSIVVEVN